MKVNALTAEKYVIEQERLVVSAVTELNNFRLSEWISTVRLNECVYDVMWDHPVLAVGKNYEQTDFDTLLPPQRCGVTNFLVLPHL